MFTGIVENVGTIDGVAPAPDGKRLRVGVGSMACLCKTGESICVSGVCLTVCAIHETALEFDVVRETLEKSTLGSRRIHDGVNIERSMRVGDRFDGHFVQGHVDGTAVVERVVSTPAEHLLWFRHEAHLTPYLIPKGSVAVDGVSLTIADLRKRAFSVALIPTTLERTTLSKLTTGDRVNIETDVITRTIVHRMSAMGSGGGITLDTLQQAGFA